MNNTTKHKSAAVLTIFDADKMTKRGRREVAKWLLHQHDNLLGIGDKYSSRFTARYLYRA